MKLNNVTKGLLVALSAVALTACNSSEESSEVKGSANLKFSFGMENTKEIANDNNIPMPNDLYFIGKDGLVDDSDKRLVIFGCGEDTDASGDDTVINGTKCSLEDLDGWSTTAPFTLPMSGDVSQLDTSSFKDGVKLFKGTTELVYGYDYTVQISSFGHLQILPLKVLEAKKEYLLVITSALQDLSGKSVQASDEYLSAKGVSINAYDVALSTAIQNAENKAVKVDITSEAILYAATFTTQSIGEELKALSTTSESIKFDTASATKYAVDSDLPLPCLGSNCVEKLSGTVRLPNYLPSSSSIATHCEPDNANEEKAKFWYELYGAHAHLESFQFTQQSCPGLYEPINFDTINGHTEVEVQMVTPPKPRTGQLDLHVVLAAHGITAVKELGNGGMTGLDNFVQPYMANEGYAVVAIDHVFHGTRGISLDGSAGYDCDGDSDGDGVIEADSGCFKNSSHVNGGKAAQLKGEYDISVSSSVRGLFSGHDHSDSKNFLKADALLTSRDNFRKVVVDILNLKSAITGSVDANNKINLISDGISIYGHSMGAIAAATAAGIEAVKEQDFSGVILANPGGAIGGIVMNSNWLGKDEVPPAVKFLPEYRVRMAKELGIEVNGDEEATLAAVRDYAETNPEAFLAKSNEVAPQFLSEFQYLIQAVVDTVDPLNYASDLVEANTPMLSMTAVGNKSINPELVDSESAMLTAADQTVPIKVELGNPTYFERCIEATGSEAFVSSANCFIGSEKKEYYSLNVTEFPLAGAEPLEAALNLNPVVNGTARSASRLIEGNHNIGVGTLTDSVSLGSADFATVKRASTEVANQAALFLKNDGALPENQLDIGIIEK